MCIWFFSVDSGTEPVEESYDFDTTKEDPSIVPSVGYYSGEPLTSATYIFDALPLSFIASLITMLC